MKRTAPCFAAYWNTDNDIPNSTWYAMYEDVNGSHNGEEVIQNKYGYLPLTPTFETWKKLTEEKKRCPRCWEETTPETFETHLLKNHDQQAARKLLGIA